MERVPTNETKRLTTRQRAAGWAGGIVVAGGLLAGSLVAGAQDCEIDNNCTPGTTLPEKETTTTTTEAPTTTTSTTEAPTTTTSTTEAPTTTTRSQPQPRPQTPQPPVVTVVPEVTVPARTE